MTHHNSESKPGSNGKCESLLEYLLPRIDRRIEEGVERLLSNLVAAPAEIGLSAAQIAEVRARVAAPAANGDDTEPQTDPTGGLVLIPCSKLQRIPSDQLWVVDGMFGRGRVTLFSALWKAGKTTFLAHLLKALEHGGEFCGHACKAARVLYITEENQGDWADRRDELGLGDHITFIERPFDYKPTWSEWQGFLDALKVVQKRDRYDLIVMDTISNLWPVRDENKAPEVREALMPLHRVIDNAALGLAHHLRKADGSEGTGSRGSGDFLAWVDIILEFRRYNAGDRQDKRRVLTGYGRRKETPAELVVHLTDDGYVAEGDRAETQQKDLTPVLDKLLPEKEPGLVFDEVRDRIKEHTGKGVRADALRATLKKGIAAGRYAQHGKRQYHYTRTPAPPDPGPHLYKDGIWDPVETVAACPVENPIAPPDPAGPEESGEWHGYVDPDATPADLEDPFPRDQEQSP
jgi:hypothetical protein